MSYVLVSVILGTAALVGDLKDVVAVHQGVNNKQYLDCTAGNEHGTNKPDHGGVLLNR